MKPVRVGKLLAIDLGLKDHQTLEGLETGQRARESGRRPRCLKDHQTLEGIETSARRSTGSGVAGLKDHQTLEGLETSSTSTGSGGTAASKRSSDPGRA